MMHRLRSMLKRCDLINIKVFWWTVTRWNCWKIKRLKFAGANHWSFAELFTALPLIATKKKIRLIKMSMFLHLYCQTGDLNNFNINSDRPNVENWCEFNLANRFWQEKRSIWRFACFFIIYLIFFFVCNFCLINNNNCKAHLLAVQPGEYAWYFMNFIPFKSHVVIQIIALSACLVHIVYSVKFKHTFRQMWRSCLCFKRPRARTPQRKKLIIIIFQRTGTAHVRHKTQLNNILQKSIFFVKLWPWLLYEWLSPLVIKILCILRCDQSKKKFLHSLKIFNKKNAPK